MCDKQELKNLAARLKQEINERGGHSLDHEDLAIIWNRAPALSEMEKRLHVDNFARQFGLIALIKSDLTSASFEKTD